MHAQLGEDRVVDYPLRSRAKMLPYADMRRQRMLACAGLLIAGTLIRSAVASEDDI